MFENFDIELIRRDIEFRTRYSTAILKGIEEENTNYYFDKVAIAASNMKVVCSHSLLVEDIETFNSSIRTASALYRKWGSPYSQLLLSLKKDNNITDKLFHESFIDDNLWYFISYFNANKAYISSKNRKLAQYIYLIFSENKFENEPLFEILKKVKSLGTLKIGISNSTIENYWEVYMYKKELIDKSPEMAKKIIEPLLFNYDNNLKQAILNKYHFNSFAMNYHPVDLDILAILNFIESPIIIKRIIDDCSISINSKKNLNKMIDLIKKDINDGMNMNNDQDMIM